MRTRTCWGMMLLIAPFVLLAALSGCDPDSSRDHILPVSQVHVVNEADGSPVADIKVVVMDPRFNMPVAGPFLSQADGLVDMGILPQTDLHLMVFGGVEYRVHSLPGYGTWQKSAGTSFAGGSVGLSGLLMDPLSGDDIAAAPVDILVRQVPVDSLPRISGMVVSANDGSPLEQVFVSLAPYLTGYQLETGPSDDVTGLDGEFSVAQIPFALNPETGNLIQISPLRFTRFGFRPVIWKYDSPNGSQEVDIRGVKIEMEWMDSYRGIITGLLERGGLPAAGVTVGLGVVDQDVDKSGPGIPGWVEVTDEFGRFLFGGLPPGTYILHPGYALGDSVVYAYEAGSPPVKVEDRDVINVGTLEIWHEIEPVNPPHGAILSSPPATLSWTAVPGALSYQVRLDGETLPLTDTNSLTLPESLTMTPGLHYWWVMASVESGGLGGITEISAVFRLLSPPD